MPKYSLDERGILTITNEADGGIYSVAMWFKRTTLILAIISLIIVIALYFAKYTHFTDVDYLKDIYEKKILSIDISSSVSMLSSKIDISYPFNTVVKNAKGQPNFYSEVLKIVAERVEGLFNMVWTAIHNIFN